MAKDKSGGALVSAAQTLEAELRRFDDEVGAFAKLALTSRKSLERGRQLLDSLAAAEARAAEQVQALVRAVAATGQDQAARVEAVRAKAQELDARWLELQTLVGQFEDLGAGAAALNAKLKGDQTTVEVDAEVSALVSRAEQLVAHARAQHFDDVAHLADQLRQQVCAIRGKLLGAAGPAA